MNPDQIQWTRSANGVQANFSLTCSPDGTLHLASGEFTATYETEEEAYEAISKLIQHGQQQAKQTS